MRIKSIICFCGLAWTQEMQSLPMSLQGRLTDPYFAKDSVELVLLETGATQKILGGDEFRFVAPMDTVWNLCALSFQKERCYLIQTQDSSTQVRGIELQNQDSVFYSTSYLDELEAKFAQKPTTSYTAAEKKLLESSQSESATQVADEVQEGSTKLRKVVMNIKKRPKRALGQSTVSAKNIKRMPSLAEADVVKAIQALPGVVASSDFSSKIYVRGGGADQNLFLFDKAPVFSPVHFFGLFSTFLVEGVDKVDFYKGGFAPQYGNRLSSVVDVQTKKGGLDDSLSTETWWKWNPREIGQEAAAFSSAILSPISIVDLCYQFDCYDKPKDQFGGSFLLSTFASTLHLSAQNGPVRVQVAGRSTYLKEMLALFRELKVTDLDLDYRFYDLQGALDYDAGENGAWKFSFYQGEDVLDFSPFVVSWGNTAIPLNYRKKMENGDEWGATLSYSQFNQIFDLASLIRLENAIDHGQIKPYWNHKLSEENTLVSGVELQLNKAKFVNKVQLFSSPTDTASNSTSNRLEDGGYFSISSPFVELRHMGETWDYNMGLRTNFETPLNDISLEPRLSLTWKYAPAQKIDFHVGRYFQYINSILFSNFESINEFYYPSVKTSYNEVKPSKSILLSLGWNNAKLFDVWDLSIEGFYKTLDNLVSFRPTEVSSETRSQMDFRLGDALKDAEGYSYGSEFSLRKNEGIVSGGLSYSYGRSVINEAGQIFPANWDKSNSIKFDLGLNWKGEDGIWQFKKAPKGRYLRSSLSISWTSGLPHTSVLGHIPSHLPSQGNGERTGGPSSSFGSNVSIPNSSRNQDRYPNYLRADLKAIDWGVENEWNFSWTIINITNHKNIFLYNYDRASSPPVRTEVPQFPFLPVMLSYQRYF